MEGRTTTVVRTISVLLQIKKEMIKISSLKNGGQRWIRTTVPSREQIYSLSPLATRPSTLIQLSLSILKIFKYALDEI